MSPFSTTKPFGLLSSTYAVTSCGDWEGLSAIKAGGDGDDLSVPVVPA